MTKHQTVRPANGGINFLAGFSPLQTLWNGPGAMYPSEQSARWAKRVLAPALAQAGAVALVRGSLMVHPQRWAEVAERNALECFRQRVVKQKAE